MRSMSNQMGHCFSIFKFGCVTEIVASGSTSREQGKHAFLVRMENKEAAKKACEDDESQRLWNVEVLYACVLASFGFDFSLKLL